MHTNSCSIDNDLINQKALGDLCNMLFIKHSRNDVDVILTFSKPPSKAFFSCLFFFSFELLSLLHLISFCQLLFFKDGFHHRVNVSIATGIGITPFAAILNFLRLGCSLLSLYLLSKCYCNP